MTITTARTPLAWPRHPWLLAAILLVFAAIHLQFVLKVQRSENMRSAFLRWRVQLEELDDGVNVWDKHAYPNPPIMAIVLKPFLDLPPTLGSSLWFFLKAILAFASIVLVWRLLDSPDRPFPIWGKALAALLSFRPIEGDLIHGNVNLLILFLIVAALTAFVHRRDGLSGFLLGFAIACKLTPALFLFYFAYKRAWKSLLGAAAGLLLFGLVIPSIYFGWQNNLDYLRSWHNQMVAPYAAGVVTSEHKNQSLPGVLHRLLCDEASFSDYDGDRKFVLETHNVASWHPDVVRAVVVGCMILYALLAMFFCRTPLTERPCTPMMAEFSVVVLGMLLFSERTWKHHCVTLLLPFAVLAYGLCTPIFARPVRWRIGTTLLVAAGLMLATSTGFADELDRIGKLSQVYGAYTGAFLALLAGVFLILRKMESEECLDTPAAERLRDRAAQTRSLSAAGVARR